MNKGQSLIKFIGSVIGLFFLANMFVSSAYGIDRRAIYKHSSRSVVLIACLDKNGKLLSQGTGTVIRSDGMILTNNHVISVGKRPCPILALFFKPDKIRDLGLKSLGKPLLARVVKRKPSFDLALVKIVSPPGKLDILSLDGSDNIGVGSDVIAIGHPGGGSLWSLTAGRISANIEDFGGKKGYAVYQTDTALNSGNSGGPLIDKDGELAGVNTSVKRGKGKRVSIEGIGFAIQSSTVKRWLGANFFGELPQQKATPKAGKQPQQFSKQPQNINPKQERALDKNKLTQFLANLYSKRRIEKQKRRKQKETKPEVETKVRTPKKNDRKLDSFLNNLGID